jgi:hypothetical protein
MAAAPLRDQRDSAMELAESTSLWSNHRRTPGRKLSHHAAFYSPPGMPRAGVCSAGLPNRRSSRCRHRWCPVLGKIIKKGIDLTGDLNLKVLIADIDYADVELERGTFARRSSPWFGRTLGCDPYLEEDAWPAGVERASLEEVLPQEPADHPLLSDPNVTLTPHAAFYSLKA